MKSETLDAIILWALVCLLVFWTPLAVLIWTVTH